MLVFSAQIRLRLLTRALSRDLSRLRCQAMPPVNQTALITGASAGMGYEFAHLFARDKYNLVLVARSGRRLAELAEQLRQQYGIAVKSIPLDLGASPAASQIPIRSANAAGRHSRSMYW